MASVMEGARAAAEKSVFERILEWSGDRPMWQRDALRRIVAKGKLEAADIKELVELCKQGKGAAGIALRPAPLERGHLPANPGQADAVSLLAISDMLGVNNLAPGQTVAFEPKGVTIVYGDNGAGKSGYGRILKRVCRARHAGKIEPNVYDFVPTPASATITYAVAGVARPPEGWKDADRPHAMLSAVSVFDSECAAVHLSKENEVAFRPFGLDIPDELANACQQVKDSLAAEQRLLQAARNPLFAKPLGKPGGAVATALAQLRAASDIEKIRTLGSLTIDEHARLARLREDLAKDIGRGAAEQKLKADNVKRLTDDVKTIAERTSDGSLAALFALDKEARTKRSAAKIAADRAFGGEPLEGVGGDVWRLLWEAARRYSTEAAYPAAPFPAATERALCLLCQQPLEAEARGRMVRFEAFIQHDAERQAKAADSAAAAAKQGLAAVPVSTRNLKASLQEVDLQNVVLAQKTRRFLAAARMRKYTLLRAFGKDGEPKYVDAGASPVDGLAKLEATIRAYEAELRQAAGGEERKKLEAERDALADRELLGDMMDAVVEEVSRLKKIAFLEDCAGDTVTNKITALGNDIADSVITPKLRDRFTQEIIRLAADRVRVEVVRSGGRYGSPQYQVRLIAKPDAKVQDILSEGERTCVALAAFLTEVATALHQSAFVFDDPVSSLDHRWRDKVAKRLVEEAAQRQVIVFTHDLIFVNDLTARASENHCPTLLLSVSRGPEGAGVVTEGLPWKAQSVAERIDRMEKAARAARDLYDRHDEDNYHKAAANIYEDLRASWERAIEDVAFFHVILRHRDYIDTRNLKKASVLSAEDCDAFAVGFKKCCDIISAHDPARGRNAVAPPPNDIFVDIAALGDWVKGIRDKQKLIP